ncbi:MAG: histidine kinase [Sterolibacteriaceae bacterium MAG5]|nr:histidine kinase [Candidatus Nitricoxidireducens bremensis]
MGSIRENPLAARLPDLCNLGIWLRVLLAVNAGALAAALARNRDLALLPAEFAEMAVLVEPVALGSLMLLCAGKPLLARCGDRLVAAAMVLVPMAVALFFVVLFQPLLGLPAPAWRPVFWAGAAAVLLLAGFDLLSRARSPALSEARLMALTARIRPHFLFNSLNAVLGIMRSDPRRAEAALEELAELFRALMRENRDLVPLSDEIALARQYLDLEHLRLGERLRVRWDVESCPPDALVPPLMLQPLLENAVYHGIEPLEAGGEIAIRIAGERGRVSLELANPCAPESDHHAGNRMALANIRERLMLFFDLEASLDIRQEPGRYLVHISLPYRGDRRP